MGMETIRVERLDHLGIVAGVIKDLGIIEMIDARIPPAAGKEEISTGEAIAGMILNGLGFSDRPMSLTPQFFENKPMDILIRPGVSAAHFNRFKLGRSLDDVFTYGCDLLFSEIASNACRKEAIDRRFNHLDTSTFSLTGEYLPDTDEQAIEITHGHSKDHRPDLKQAVLELMSSHDGGVPFLCKTWNGNGSDNAIFEARSKELIKQFEASEGPRYLIADSKLYSEANAANLAHHRFLTRIPGTLKIEHQLIAQAWQSGSWTHLEEGYRAQSVELCHYGMEQRWLIIYSDAAWNRAESTLTKIVKKEHEATAKHLFHLQAKRFSCEQDARDALEKIVQGCKYHVLAEVEVVEHIRYAKKGKPTADTPIKAIEWQIKAGIKVDPERIVAEQQYRSCFILGTNIAELSDLELLKAYKGQSSVERGFRFLKDPLFFTSSLFLKKPSRIQGLLMVMTLSLLVYSIAERRLRKQLDQQQQTLPNQIGQPTATPTLRWIFQMLDGIHRVSISLQDQVKIIIEGMSDLRRKILSFFGDSVLQIYQLSVT
jgi:transposase